MQGLFPLLVFLVVTALVLLVLLLFGGDAGRRVRERVAGITQRPAGEEEQRSLLREQYLRQLSPLEQWIEALPGMRRLETLCEQAGRHLPAYRVLLLSLALAAGAALVLLAFGRPWLALLAFIGVLPLPYLKLIRERNQRIELFEAQLPDALEVMSRALRAGNPFNETLRVVAEEMDDPIATEFGITFSDLNYGVSVKAAFKGLLERTPNVSLAALVTAVLVQRETGGNMAEILDRIAGVLRQRQRFQRRVRTLTAEGRVSAWILVLMPFVLAIMLSLIAPSYLPMLLEHPVGLRLIGVALAVMAFGIWWVRRIVRVRY
jgi:tight adherence protein B